MTTLSNETVELELGGELVEVPKGGLYDRYRMNTDLDEVSRDPLVSSVEFFRHLPKTKVESRIGPTLTPNYYYRISTARLTMLAPTRAIRARLPKALSPLEVTPGLGLISFMAFRYAVCDIDFYTEAAVAIPVRPARHGRLAFFDLATGLKNDHLHAYVLSLPVSSKIAQIRGNLGYGFPKWVSKIDVDINASQTCTRVYGDLGTTDFSLSGPTPAQRTTPSGTRISLLTSYTQLGGAWHSTLSETNTITSGTSYLPRNLTMELGQGRISEDIRSLEPMANLRFDVTTEAQLALHMPLPITVSHRP